MSIFVILNYLIFHILSNIVYLKSYKNLKSALKL